MQRIRTEEFGRKESYIWGYTGSFRKVPSAGRKEGAESGSSRPGPTSAPGSRELGVSCLFQSGFGDSGVLRLFMVRRAVPIDWGL